MPAPLPGCYSQRSSLFSSSPAPTSRIFSSPAPPSVSANSLSAPLSEPLAFAWLVCLHRMSPPLRSRGSFSAVSSWDFSSAFLFPSLPKEFPISIRRPSTFASSSLHLVSLSFRMLFGLAPALHAPAPELLLGKEVRTTARSFLRHSLITTQVAVSLILLAAAGLLLRSLWNLQSVSLGLTPSTSYPRKSTSPNTAILTLFTSSPFSAISNLASNARGGAPAGPRRRRRGRPPPGRRPPARRPRPSPSARLARARAAGRPGGPPGRGPAGPARPRRAPPAPRGRGPPPPRPPRGPPPPSPPAPRPPPPPRPPPAPPPPPAAPPPRRGRPRARAARRGCVGGGALLVGKSGRRTPLPH